MPEAENPSLVLVTAPDIDVARNLARSALENRLIACANLVPHVESLYWWQGKINQDDEVLLVLKTQSRWIDELERQLVREHPYDTPEFITIPITGGHAPYLAWIATALQTQPDPPQSSNLPGGA